MPSPFLSSHPVLNSIQCDCSTRGSLCIRFNELHSIAFMHFYYAPKSFKKEPLYVCSPCHSMCLIQKFKTNQNIVSNLCLSPFNNTHLQSICKSFWLILNFEILKRKKKLESFCLYGFKCFMLTFVLICNRIDQILYAIFIVDVDVSVLNRAAYHFVTVLCIINFSRSSSIPSFVP